MLLPLPVHIVGGPRRRHPVQAARLAVVGRLHPEPTEVRLPPPARVVACGASDETALRVPKGGLAVRAHRACEVAAAEDQKM